MSRPLIVCDCDEVLLHMVMPFKQWLEESEGVRFDMEGGNFATALKWQDSGEVLGGDDVWRLLGGFFDTEMDRQMPIDGAVEGINRLAEKAEVVVLTNLVDKRRERRAEQLAKHGIHAQVFTNQGPKGPALQKILQYFAPSQAIFIDDLPQHHQSVAQTTPQVRRLHLCGEPLLAKQIACAHQAGHAHARIDQWSKALPWLLGEIERTKK